ncbi:ABC transporter ATP-binding protein [Williamwhitmania taraxaci]|uniref:ATP-binding cassette, subfamily B, MsbA n=1 Tax=Williamwhitmania taraxaci TaxID=1640674 RepID=A0A1G6RNR5_9BACT|nr:ABC transporter ATP-binding protein [Williamwhitmania taraxaci]SDD05576.1 ATP-binding cassette, subfamily B, MsbA [Williamwhitmania taraxaci]
MKKFGKIFKYLIPYKGTVGLIIGLNILGAFFSVFTLAMVIPFLNVLFDQIPAVTSTVPFSLSVNSILHNFNYFISSIKVSQGITYALVFMCTFVVIMTFFKNLFTYLSLYYMAPFRNGVVRDIRNKMYRKVLELPLGYYSEERKGDIISKITNDVNELEVSIMRSMEMFFRDPILVIVYMVVLLIMSPQLTLFVFVLLPVAGLLIGRIGKNLRKHSFKGQRRLGFLLSTLEETLGGLRIIKAFNAEEKMIQRFESTNSFYTRILVKVNRRRDLASPLSEFLGVAVVVILMWYGGKMVLKGDGSLTAASLIGYLVIFSQIITPAKSFSQAYFNVLKGMASADRIDAVIEADNPIKEKDDARVVEQFGEKIEYRNVCFKYQDEPVLRNVSLTIEKGKTVALVGQSGSGKSTFVDLLPRFYDATEGEILVDGVDIKDFSIKSLRGLMGNVNQEPILFNDTFYNNIAFGLPNATIGSVMAAAKVANAHDFIEASPNGYYTNIGDRGGKLSGGQRQRVSIARAILKNPPIMILDEATSALDTESERLVQEALENLMKNRTSIVIAHRLSTVKNADLICVLQDGEIVERGKHDELIGLGGIYSKLYNLQR